MITLATMHNIGAMNDVPKIEVTDAPTSHTISQGKGTIIFQNQGSEICFCGGTTVNYANNRGFLLTPMAALQFDGTTNSFKVYFVCSTGKETTIGVIECEK